MVYYVKAYQIARLRAFADWPGDPLDDEAVVFVHPDFSVRSNSLPEGDASAVLLPATPSFRAFAESELAYEPPS